MKAKNSTFDKAEKIKKNIAEFAGKSKEAIHELINASTKHMEGAIDVNSKIFDEIKKKLDMQGVDDVFSGMLKHTFVKSVTLAEDTFDAIINSYSRQMELTVDFNTRLVEAIKESNPANADKFLELIRENFERSKQLITDNTKEILDFYNKHTNLALNFNKTFADSVNTQVEALFQIQSKGFDRFTKWASEWWKDDAAKENA